MQGDEPPDRSRTLSRDHHPRRTFALQDVPGLSEHPGGIWREISYHWFTGNADRS